MNQRPSGAASEHYNLLAQSLDLVTNPENLLVQSLDLVTSPESLLVQSLDSVWILSTLMWCCLFVQDHVMFGLSGSDGEPS